MMIFGGPATKYPSRVRNPHVLAQMRAREEEAARAEQQKTLKHTFEVTSRAAWENRTTAKIEQRAVLQRAKAYRREAELQLEARRARLAALLERETKQYQDELASNIETPEERRQQCVSATHACMLLFYAPF